MLPWNIGTALCEMGGRFITSDGRHLLFLQLSLPSVSALLACTDCHFMRHALRSGDYCLLYISVAAPTQHARQGQDR